MPKTHAHVYRHRLWQDDIPAEHSYAVLSGGPYVVVYGNKRDGWYEHQGQWGGYNMHSNALEDALWLAGDGARVHDHA